MTKYGKLILATAAGSLAAGSVVAQEFPDSRYVEHMWGNSYGWSMMGYGGMFVFWILVIAAIVFAFRWAMDRDSGKNQKDNALDILKERLARGEIEAADYEERRKILEKE